MQTAFLSAFALLCQKSPIAADVVRGRLRRWTGGVSNINTRQELQTLENVPPDW